MRDRGEPEASAQAETKRADLPLNDALVLDFGQFLAGPVAAMRLADLGARVIKIERPGTGDSGRALAFGDMYPDGDALSFHIQNRGKQSVVADLRDAEDLAFVRRLVARADVLIHNFRPGVMERYGLGYATVSEGNPGLVYATVSGYGSEGPWADKPGQDLLAQARSGLMWLSGCDADPPIPVGVSIADQMAAHNLMEGVLAALVRRARTGRGALVETSLMEAAVDMQFEFVAAALHAPDVRARRPARYGAHRFLSAPYGVFPTQDGYLALAMNHLPRLGQLLEIEALARDNDPARGWAERDDVNRMIAGRVGAATTAHWLGLLEPAGVWCAPVLTLEELLKTPAFEALHMVQTTTRSSGPGGEALSIRSTRAPYRIDGSLLASDVAAPRLGQHTEQVRAECTSAGREDAREGTGA